MCLKLEIFCKAKGAKHVLNILMGALTADKAWLNPPPRNNFWHSRKAVSVVMQDERVWHGESPI